MISAPKQQRPQEPFQGFEPLTANYVYSPNQFFDVCLPHCSRGTVRIVAYILRETLGWLDSDGNPLRQNITVTYRDLVQKAGVSRGAIAPALQEAVNAGFIQCDRAGQSKTAGKPSQSASYSLRWDLRGEYIRDPSRFAGLFAGEGHRTPVPNRFFDNVVRRESLSVVKVVGTVIRHTIGYQNQFGGRRSSAPLSYSRIQQYSNLQDRSTLSAALKYAQEVGYIECIDTGNFSSNLTEQRPASYSICWLEKEVTKANGSKIRPEAERFKTPTRNGSESRPDDRFKNQTSIEKTSSNNILKQQAVADQQKGIHLLKNAGLDSRTAKQLLEKRGLEVIENQLAWLDARNPTENRIGMLRKAILDNWGKPKDLQEKERRNELRAKQRIKKQKQAQEEAEIARLKQERQERRQQLLHEWSNASQSERELWIQAAVEKETSKRLADILRKESADADRPHFQVLEMIAEERLLPSLVNQ